MPLGCLKCLLCQIFPKRRHFGWEKRVSIDLGIAVNKNAVVLNLLLLFPHGKHFKLQPLVYIEIHFQTVYSGFSRSAAFSINTFLGSFFIAPGIL